MSGKHSETSHEHGNKSPEQHGGGHANHGHDDHHGGHGDKHHAAPAAATHDHHGDDPGHAAPAAPKEPLVIKIRPMRLPIARESWLFIVPLLVVAGLLWSFSQTTLLILVALAIAYVIFFFRDVDRLSPQDDSLILAPADGKVISITKVKEDDFLKTECHKVSIFMSLFDNHINRLPVAGKIVYQRHKNGEWLAANTEEASERNEKNYLGVECKRGNIFLAQVAGLVARRIVSRVSEGDTLKQGERFGLIMFGSRLDVYLPVSKVTLEVKLGQRVDGGVTVIGIYND